MDGEVYLDCAARKGRTFDLVVLHPTTFSRAVVRVFALETDYFRPLPKARRRVPPGGRGAADEATPSRITGEPSRSVTARRPARRWPRGAEPSRASAL